MSDSGDEDVSSMASRWNGGIARTPSAVGFVAMSTNSEGVASVSLSLVQQLRRFALAFIHSHSGATGVFRNAFREFVG